MSFLYCNPSVFAIENRYEILINTVANGQCTIKVGRRKFISERAGILLSETTTHKISIPQSVLDKAGKYTICYKRSIDKKSYFSEFGKEQKLTFLFNGVSGKEKINAYHIADIHYNFDKGVALADFYGKNTDILIVNGDIGEVEKVQDFLDVAKLVGDISKGGYPVIFTRGNHDTRGRCASEFSSYFPTKNGNHFYTINLGFLRFIILDCGEDKLDSHPEYGGANNFKTYRKKQTAFLKNLKKDDSRISVCVCHACPGGATQQSPVFNIEQDTYGKWVKELERISIKFMLVGHTHHTNFIQPKKAPIPQEYPIIVGSALGDGGEGAVGTAITIDKHSLVARFTDTEKTVLETNKIVF